MRWRPAFDITGERRSVASTAIYRGELVNLALLCIFIQEIFLARY
jgi:hypothetical protein